MTRRFLRTIGYALCCIGILIAVLSCKTAADVAAAQEAENRISELMFQLNENQSLLAAANLRVQELEATLRSLPGQIAELEEKETKNQATIKDLIAQKAKLEQLLAEVQTMQLSTMVSNASTEQVPASSAPPARAGNPAENERTRNLANNAAGSTVNSTPIPAESMYRSSLSFTDTIALWPPNTVFDVQNTLGKDRSERKKTPGTPLFSERDASKNILFFYHRDQWYQTPGVHIEIAQFSGREWGARLVVVTTKLDRAENAFLEYVLPAKNGAPEQQIADFGIPDGWFSVSGFETPRRALWYQLTPSRVRDLYRAMEQTGNLWRLSTAGTGQGAGEEGVLSPSQRKILLDMLAATKDLTASGSR